MDRSHEPASSTPNSAAADARADLQERVVEHNDFYTNLPLEAKERFLEALESAARRGLSEADAWTEAVEAAQQTYWREP